MTFIGNKDAIKKEYLDKRIINTDEHNEAKNF